MFLKYSYGILLILAGLIVDAQGYPDKVYMGIKGPVKQFTSTTYKDIIKKGSLWKPVDTARFLNRYTVYFNNLGFEDSMHLWYRKPYKHPQTGEMEDSLVFEQKISTYENGKKTGCLTYRNSVLIQQEKYIRSDDSISIKNIINSEGKVTTATHSLLSINSCPEKFIVITYDSAGNEIFKKEQWWKRDEHCNVLGLEEKNGDTVTKYEYLVKQLSTEHQFPLETWIIPEDKKTPVKITYRTVEFY